MRQRRGWWITYWLCAATLGWAVGGQAVQAEGPCVLTCPEGTKPATRDRYLSGDAATYQPGCATYCEALTPCVAPRVLVLSEGSAACVLRPGFEALPPAESVDLSFALAWDPRLVPPSDPMTCQNGVLDAGEGDLDCGGFCPRACDLGATCRADLDCVSGELGACVNGRCGGFLAPQVVSLPLALSPQQVWLDDWSADGRDDLLIYVSQPQPALYLLRGQGDGAFGLGGQATLSGPAQSLALGGLDGVPVMVATVGDRAQVVTLQQGALGAPQDVPLPSGARDAQPIQRADGGWLLVTTPDGGTSLVPTSGSAPQPLTLPHSDALPPRAIQAHAAAPAHLLTADAQGVWLHRADGAGWAAPALLLPTQTPPRAWLSLPADSAAVTTADGPTGQQIQALFNAASASPSTTSSPIPANAGVRTYAVADLGGPLPGPNDEAWTLSAGLYVRFDSADPALYLSHLPLPQQALTGRHDLSRRLLILHTNGTLSLLTPGGTP